MSVNWGSLENEGENIGEKNEKKEEGYNPLKTNLNFKNNPPKSTEEEPDIPDGDPFLK